MEGSIPEEAPSYVPGAPVGADRGARVRADRLPALTAALAETHTVDDVAGVVVADLVAALGARTGTLALRVRDADALEVVRLVGFPADAVPRVRRQSLAERGPAPECVRTAAPVWVESRQGRDGFDARYPAFVPVWDALGVHAGAFVPLVAGGEAVGAITFTFDAPHVFAPEERAFLVALGRHAALAVERARLLQAERAALADADAARRAAEAAERRVRFLAAASSVLAESLDPEAVLGTVARLAIGTVDAPGLADACVVTLATPEEARAGRWTTLIEGLDPARVAIERERQRRYPAPPDGPRGFPAVIRTGRSELVTPEMMEAQLRPVVRADPEHWAYFEALDLYAAVTAPLVARGRVLGALNLVRHGPARRGAFDAADLALAEELARRAAVALDNARLYVAARQSRADAEAARQEAEQARADAEAASRAKSEFLAVMSHELRTPLNAIGGYAQLMEMGIRGPVTEQQRDDLARIQQSQKHLLGLIGQVLNYARLDAGAVRYDVVDVPVAEALVAAEALVLPQARARGLTFVVERGADGLTVRADREKLQQILLNPLSNAIKFTEAGGAVRMAYAVQADDVAVSVTDTGIGIPSEKQGSVFEPFVQGDQRLTRPHEGVGLGLAISRELARGMGGDLAVRSTPGEGSTFVLRLPRAR